MLTPEFLAQLRELDTRRTVEAFSIPLDAWTAFEWYTALVGETGELANVLKKIKRDGANEKLNAALISEIADVVVYLDLLAASCGVSFQDRPPRVPGSATVPPAQWMTLLSATMGRLADDLLWARERDPKIVEPKFHSILAVVENMADALFVELTLAVRAKFNEVSDRRSWTGPRL